MKKIKIKRIKAWAIFSIWNNKLSEEDHGRVFIYTKKIKEFCTQPVWIVPRRERKSKCSTPSG